MQSLVLIIHVALSVGVIGLVLIQHGKGADAGAAFGSGASATVFGARGAATFMTRMTTLLVSLFFITSLTLFYLAANRDRGTGSVTDLPATAPASVSEPAADPGSDLPAEIDGDSAPAPDAGTDAEAGAATGEETPSGSEAADLPADKAPSSEDDLPPAE